jgi:hypothetical protein
MSEGATQNAFTVDVEDWFHVSAFRNHVARGDWDHCELRVERNTDRLLELMSEANGPNSW